MSPDALTYCCNNTITMPKARKAVIRIMVSGLDGIGEIGPIPVVASDTIREVEAKVQAWIAENVGDFEAPEEGVLGLALEGKSLESGESLYDQQISDMSTFEVPAKEPEAGEEGDSGLLPEGEDVDGAEKVMDGGENEA